MAGFANPACDLLNFGAVDRVDYLGGATFVTNENSGKSNGVTIGIQININIEDEITGNFDDYVVSHPLYMHEYGHTIDSQIFGFSYLFAILLNLSIKTLEMYYKISLCSRATANAPATRQMPIASVVSSHNKKKTL